MAPFEFAWPGPGGIGVLVIVEIGTIERPRKSHERDYPFVASAGHREAALDRSASVSPLYEPSVQWCSSVVPLSPEAPPLRMSNEPQTSSIVGSFALSSDAGVPTIIT